MKYGTLAMINVRYAGLPTRIICKAPRVKRNLDKLLKNVTQLNSVYLKVYKITLTSKYRTVTTRKKHTWFFDTVYQISTQNRPSALQSLQSLGNGLLGVSR